MMMVAKTSDKASLEITRFLNAPPARIYAAWTDPAELQRWFGPEDVRTINIAADVRVGGKYRWDLLRQDGEQWTCLGEYRELIPERKIVFTWKWDDDDAWDNYDSIVTIELLPREGGTELRLTHRQLPSEESRDGHNKGWSNVLDKLATFINA